MPGVTEVINKQIASINNIVLMKHTLENVVIRGVGKMAASPNVSVAGKTGTSQVNEYYEGDSSVAEYQLAFCGFFPADKPQYSMIISLNKLGLPASGGGMAGPVFSEIVEWMYNHKLIDWQWYNNELNAILVNSVKC